MSENECTYCSSGLIREREVARNDLAWSFPSNMPIVPGHMLILPIRHVATADQLKKEERDAMFDMLTRLQRALASVFSAGGFNIAWNEGAVAGQSISHLHIHLVPRKAGDTGISEFEPRRFLYRPGVREVSPELELREVATLIRGALGRV